MEDKERTTKEMVQKGIYTEKIKGVHSTIKNHLEPSYRKQYNIRRFVSCFILFWILKDILISLFIVKFFHIYSSSASTFLAIIWTILAWIFWHYSFWSFQGGVVDTFSRNIIYFGSIWSLVWKIIVQNIVIQLWIAFIAPFSGIKTWRKAVKNNKILFVENNKNSGWN